MKIWRCWPTRRRIPRWIRGACSRSEAAAVAAHVRACSACTVEAALAAALADGAGTGISPSDAHREATWARFEQALAREDALPAVKPSLALSQRLRFGLLAVVLVLALALPGRRWTLSGDWGAERSARGGPRAPRLNLSLLEPESGVDDPMGPTTERLLVLMERKRVTRRAGGWAGVFMALLLLAGQAALAAADEGEREAFNLYRELDLSESQSARLTALQGHVEAQDRQLKRRLNDRREALEALYRPYDLDRQRTRPLRKEIRDIQDRLLQLHESFQVELRQILSRSQFERLQQELREREGRERRRERQQRERDDKQ